jgi:uracil phosphoribosyltransferase
MPVRVLEHPLAQHLLTGLRDRETPPSTYRALARTLSTLLVLEATRDLPVAQGTVQTPLEEAQAVRMAQGLAVVPILRAGLSMLEPALELFPDVAV